MDRLAARVGAFPKSRAGYQATANATPTPVPAKALPPDNASSGTVLDHSSLPLPGRLVQSEAEAAEAWTPGEAPTRQTYFFRSADTDTPEVEAGHVAKAEAEVVRIRIPRTPEPEPSHHRNVRQRLD